MADAPPQLHSWSSFTLLPPVQKLASAFLYISQMLGNLMGNMQNLQICGGRAGCEVKGSF